MINVNVGGSPMMIDTGATCTCIQTKYAILPMSGQFVKTVGFLGKTQLTLCLSASETGKQGLMFIG